MPLQVEMDPSGGVRIAYDLEWLHDVMLASSGSMVAFRYFSATEPAKGESKKAGGKTGGAHKPGAKKSGPEINRVYPRSNGPGFLLLEKTPTLDTAPKAGGRHHREVGRLERLCALFETGTQGLRVPLSDIAILSKRAVCVAVVESCKAVNFTISGGAPVEERRSPGWRIHGYPMLCVIGRHAGGFPANQGQWRAVQCVFGAKLTQLIRAARIGLEVVSREGFGSVFPTLADLPNGIRLDPGLLPPEAGTLAIATALRFTDAFISAMRKSTAPLATIDGLGGMDETKLAGVDRLMSALLELMRTSPALAPGDCAAFVTKFDNRAASYSPAAIEGLVEYHLEGVPVPVGAIGLKDRSKQRGDWNYGSDSEDEGEWASPSKTPSKGDGDADVVVANSIVVKKVSLITGMAALRMATSYGMRYSKWLYSDEGSLNESPLKDTQWVGTWAPYFELDQDELFKKLPSTNGVRVLIFDGAPNPINIPDAPSVFGQVGLGAIVIDTTNNTTREKAEYLSHFVGALARSQVRGAAGGVLLMVDSASKHPTGGDLVHGVMRICGTRGSVDTFIDKTLKPHLLFKLGKDKEKELGWEKKLSVLSPEETRMRRRLLDIRMLMRNADLLNAGIAIGGLGSKLGGAVSGVARVGASVTGGPRVGGRGGEGPPPAPVLDVPLLTPNNLGRVRRVVLAALPMPVAAVAPPQKEGSASVGPGPIPVEKKDTDSAKKAYAAQGAFAGPVHHIPDLTRDDSYYEENDIYNLQRYLLRGHANVAVLEGVDRRQWLEMNRNFFTTEYHPAITTATDTIIQPLQRNNNHWALVFITLGARGPGGRPVRMLYVDPLNPNNVPVEDLRRLTLPFPGLEAEHCLLQYQDDIGNESEGAQTSCGAWVVELAVRLVLDQHVLPAISPNRKAAALALRAAHQLVIRDARDLDWPVAPADVRLHVTA
ncbi:hypothetical protein LXT21_26030 [Myxococcus sp. K38C18041901]|uniref:hypothetical protein n=1 Tax=Myxococcus guangdongensis TaxID=2906760 RepID=UPI0020A80387|nr:hypothetical protein [Myxococcus guangdongensis]MCP3062253.1 hypothetical protein [Myxococcus guangdongensis]